MQFNISDIISEKDFFIFNRNLKNFKNKTISISSLNSPLFPSYDLPKLDEKDQIYLLFKKEIKRDLYKNILCDIFLSKNVNYIDLIKFNGKYELKKYEEIYFNIIKLKYNNIISSSKIMSELQDIKGFSPIQNLNNHIIHNGGDVYNIGSLNREVFKDISLWVDPYMKYTDDKIALFNDIDLNFEILNTYTQASPTTMQDRIHIEYKFDYVVNNSEILCLIESENSPSYKEFLSIRREIKIDNIIN